MKCIPEALKDQKFVLHKKVKHTEFMPFLLQHNWTYSTLHLIYNAILFLFLVMTMVFIFYAQIAVLNRLIYVGLGILIAVLLVPLHELIHCLTYKYLGATHVTITPFIPQGYVLTLADRFIVNKQKMKWIAIAPFIVITVVGTGLLFILNSPWQILISAIILFHASLCRTDFKILDYFHSSDFELIMYTEIEAGETFIYKQPNDILFSE